MPGKRHSATKGAARAGTGTKGRQARYAKSKKTEREMRHEARRRDDYMFRAAYNEARDETEYAEAMKNAAKIYNRDTLADYVKATWADRMDEYEAAENYWRQFAAGGAEAAAMRNAAKAAARGAQMEMDDVGQGVEEMIQQQRLAAANEAAARLAAAAAGVPRAALGARGRGARFSSLGVAANRAGTFGVAKNITSARYARAARDSLFKKHGVKFKPRRKTRHAPKLRGTRQF